MSLQEPESQGLVDSLFDANVGTLVLGMLAIYLFVQQFQTRNEGPFPSLGTYYGGNSRIDIRRTRRKKKPSQLPGYGIYSAASEAFETIKGRYNLILLPNHFHQEIVGNYNSIRDFQ